MAIKVGKKGIRSVGGGLMRPKKDGRPELAVLPWAKGREGGDIKIKEMQVRVRILT